MRKKGPSEVMVRAVVSLYDGNGKDKSGNGIWIFKGI